jgi:hypothetical protein
MAAMGYFDDLAGSYFKLDANGRTLFFPYGIIGGGYVIASPAERQWITRAITIYMPTAGVLTAAVIMGSGIVGGIVIGAVLIAFYFAWMMYQLRGHERAGERMTYLEIARNQAMALHPAMLWTFNLASAALVICAVVLLINVPDNRPTAALGLLLFGAAVAHFSYQIMVRRQGNAARR